MYTCIDIEIHSFLEKPDEYLSLYRRACVDQVHLYVGPAHHMCSLEDIDRVRRMVCEAGFHTALVAVPVGHPKTADSEPDPTPQQAAERILPGWRYRTGRNGKLEYYSAELTERMIADTLSYVKEYSALGFDTFFMDDDLRSANWSQRLGGCFCAECKARFQSETGYASLESEDAKLAWAAFQSQRVTHLMRGMREIIPHPGLMIMDSGDERHGVDPHAVSQIDGIHIRIGEQHFFDEDTRTLSGRAENFMAVSTHLFRLDPAAVTYSETTAVDPNEYMSKHLITPDHHYSKALLALSAGVDNIYWMCHKHWDMMGERNADLRAFAAAAQGKRSWPVHVARASIAEESEIYPDLSATVAGLPAAGVFAEEATGGEALVISPRLMELPKWKKAAEKYRLILSPADNLKSALLRAGIPVVESQQPAFLSWIPDKNRAVVFNPLDKRQTAVVFGKSVSLAAGSAEVVDP